MSSAEHVTAGEFERTTSRMFAQLDRIEAKQDWTNGRVTRLEENQKSAGKLAAKLAALVGTVAAAIIAGIFSLIGGK